MRNPPSSPPLANPGAVLPGFSLLRPHHMQRSTPRFLFAATLLVAAAWPLAVHASPAAPAAAKPAAVKPLDINSASRAQLMTLPGIGAAEADRIIAARPYPSKAKLVADKVLTQDIYAGLKGRIVAVQKAQPAKPRAGAKP